MFIKRCFAVVLCFVCVFPAGAQSQAPTASYENLFKHYAAFLDTVRKVCGSGECNALAEQGALILRDGQAKHAKGWRVPVERRRFHRDIAASLDRLHDALVRERDAQDKLAGKHAPQEKIMPADYSCDQVFAIALAICSAYLAVNPIAAAICVGTAVYAYNQCLEQAAWNPPPQWD